MIDFDLTEEQKMLKTAARDFLTEKCPDSLVREMMKDEIGYPEPIWHEMAKAGWLGLILPQAYGGEGGTFLDLGVLAEEIGRACLPTPFFTSAVCSALILLEGGSEQQKRELLPQIAKGEKIVTLALTEGSGEIEPSFISAKATRTDSAYTIQGVKLPVPYAHVADQIIAVVRTGKADEAVSLFLIKTNDHQIKRTFLETITGEKQFKVEFNKAEASEQDIIGGVNQGWEVVQKVLPEIIIAKCVEMVGAGQRVLEMTVDYSKTRKQFGHFIGSFQAIQHYCANMLLSLDSAKFLAYKAAWMLSKGLPCTTEVAMAKSRISQVYQQITVLAHQIHGAIAFCEDHPLPLYIKRAKEAEGMFGSIDYHLETIAKGLGL